MSQSKLTRLQDLSSERDELIDTLRMWAEVKEQGIDPESVDRFALRPEYMNSNQVREFKAMKYSRGLTVRGAALPAYANCVVLHNGDVVKLDPWIVLPNRTKE